MQRSGRSERPMQIIHDCGMLSRHTGDVRDGLRALLAQGIGGIVTNIRFENYMQDPAEWRRLRECLRACRGLGMRVWLYDEKGYPSGYAGGQVLARRPELEARGLYYDASSGRLTEDRSYEGTHSGNNYYVRARTANLLEPEAAGEFIRVTHERYAAELGGDLGIVEAFFTDEPALNALYMPQIPAARDIPVLDPLDLAREPLPGVPWSAKLAERDHGGGNTAVTEACVEKRGRLLVIGDRHLQRGFDWQLSSYTLELNQWPRKCLNCRTPAQMFHERPVALTRWIRARAHEGS